jgi:hypothetical protein
MPKARQSADPAEALRLVKTWLPASVVRDMDHTILAANGAYNGRDDFIREAIADRVAEERSRPEKGTAPALLLHSSTKREKQLRRALQNPTSVREPHDFEAYSSDAPTLPHHEVGGILYGLHNRDFPTLWVARSLLTMASERRAPLPWPEFISTVMEAAWNIGAQLARMDVERGADEQKASVGFPANAEKRHSSEARFLEHMVGVPDRPSGPTGPLFAMKLAGVERKTDAFVVVAPTCEARVLWQRLLSAGFGTKERPPHPPEAWWVFGEHLQSHLRGDYNAWMRVVRAIGDGPMRDELITRFSAEWAGAAAATNIAGYISRGREWGLVEPKLREGRYVLTKLGRLAVEEHGR